MIGKYLNGYANNPAGPARMVGVVRGGVAPAETTRSRPTTTR